MPSNMNNNVKTILKNNNNKIQPVLDGEKAATVSQTKFSTDSAVEYDVKGSVVVRGSKLLLGPVFPAKASVNSKKITEDVIKNSTKSVYSDYCTGSYTTSPTSDEKLGKAGKGSSFFNNILANTFLVKPKMLENIIYINHYMYDPAYVIDSGDYSNNTDQIVEDMVNASVDQYDEKSRRIAKLAKAMKNSILAQTNDTNPLYSIRVSEIYDRLLDYFTKVNRMISTVYNIEGWLKSLDVFRYGTTVVTKKLQEFYTPDYQVRLQDKLGKLEAALHGCYYDPESLIDYIDFTTVGYMNVQKGVPKFIAPIFYGSTVNTALDYNLGQTLCDAAIGSNIISTLQDFILNVLDTYINIIYGGFFSYMQTALAPFNNIAMIDSVKYPGLSVKNRLINCLAANTKLTFGLVSTSYKLVHGGLVPGGSYNDTLNVIAPIWKIQVGDYLNKRDFYDNQATGTDSENDWTQNVIGAVVNHNGFTEVAVAQKSKEFYSGEISAYDDNIWGLIYSPTNNAGTKIVTLGDNYHTDDVLLPTRFNRLSEVPVKNYEDSVSKVRYDGWYGGKDAMAGYAGDAITPTDFSCTGKFKNDIFVSYFPIVHDGYKAVNTNVAYTAGGILHRGDVVISGQLRAPVQSAMWSSPTSKGFLQYAKGKSGLFTINKPADLADDVYDDNSQFTQTIGFNAYAGRTSNGDINIFSVVDKSIVPVSYSGGNMDAYTEDKLNDGISNWTASDYIVYDIGEYLSKQAMLFGFVIDRSIECIEPNDITLYANRRLTSGAQLLHALVPDCVTIDETLNVDLGKACYLNNVTED